MRAGRKSADELAARIAEDDRTDWEVEAVCAAWEVEILHVVRSSCATIVAEMEEEHAAAVAAREEARAKREKERAAAEAKREADDAARRAAHETQMAALRLRNRRREWGWHAALCARLGGWRKKTPTL